MIVKQQPISVDYNYNKIGHFKELVTGAGSQVFKVSNAGVFAGSTDFNSAPFSVSFRGILTASGAIIEGTITASGGSITGDMLITGSLESGDSNGFQVRIKDGYVSFLYNGDENAYISISRGSNRNSIVISTDDNIYFAKPSGALLATLDVNNNLTFAQNGYIKWAQRKLTALSDKLEVDGDFKIDGNLFFATNAEIRFASRRIIGNTSNIEVDGDFKLNGRIINGSNQGIDRSFGYTDDNGHKGELKFKGGILYSQTTEN